MRKSDVIGERLRRQREAQGISQERLSDLAGVSVRTIRSWEKGDGVPNAEQLAAWAEAAIDINFVITGQPGSLNLSAAWQVLVEASGAEKPVPPLRGEPRGAITDAELLLRGYPDGSEMALVATLRRLQPAGRDMVIAIAAALAGRLSLTRR